MKISILGLGYVGAVSSACLSKQGHNVIGVDIVQSKVDHINQGKSPIVENGLEELIESGVNSGNLSATTDVDKAVTNTDISIICVGTPSMRNGNINLSYIYEVCEQISHVIKKKSSFHTIAIRSTVKPGTIEDCANLIEEISGKEKNKDFGVASNPEFLREGSAINDYFDPPYTIIGATCKQAEDALKNIYENIDAPFHFLEPEESEMIKYANNNFHAMKITFANEIGNICSKLGVDGHKVMEVVAADKKLNLSSYYLKPGFAYGGSCLPKDVRGLNYTANSLDLKTPLLNSLNESNAYQIERGLELILKTGKKKIGFLGFAFKAGTDDLRESPVLELIESLIGKGFEVSLYDSNVNLSRLTGKNKEFLKSHLPHIARLLEQDLNETISNSEVLVIGTSENKFKDLPKDKLENKIIIDLVRIDSEKRTGDNYVGICW